MLMAKDVDISYIYLSGDIYKDIRGFADIVLQMTGLRHACHSYTLESRQKVHIRSALSKARAREVGAKGPLHTSADEYRSRRLALHYRVESACHRLCRFTSRTFYECCSYVSHFAAGK